VLKIPQKPSLPQQDVLALNVVPDRYKEIFKAEPPTNLGMGLVLVLPEDADPHVVEYMSRKMYSVGMTMRALFEYDDFFDEFAPANMNEYTVASTALQLPDSILGIPSRSKTGLEVLISVSFFQGDHAIDVDFLRGCTMAMSVLDQLTTVAQCYDPAFIQPFSLPTADAASYRQQVADLYETEQAVWCRKLVPLSWTLRAGVHALLDEKPLIHSMRTRMATFSVWSGSRSGKSKP
jgi:hypothetical protein